MKKDKGALQEIQSEIDIIEANNSINADEKLRILSEIASRKKKNKLRNNLIINLFLMVASLVLTAVLAFAVVLMFTEKTHKVSFFIESALVDSINIKDESTIDQQIVPAVDTQAYEFDGHWYTNPRGLGTPYNFEQQVTSNISLYAGAVRRTVNLKIYLNDDNISEKHYALEGKFGDIVEIFDGEYILKNLSQEYKDNYNLVGFDTNKDAKEPEYSSTDQLGLFEGELYAIWRGKSVNIQVSGVGAQLIGGGNFTGETINEHYGNTYSIDIEKYLTTVCQVETGASVRGIRVIQKDGSYEDKTQGQEIVVYDGMRFELLFVEGEINKLTIDFKNGDAEKVYLGFQKVTLPDATQLHHVLKGYNGEKGTLPSGAEIEVKGNIIYTAQWQEAVYKITLQSDANTNEHTTTEFYQRYNVGFYYDEQTETELDISEDSQRHVIVPPHKLGYDFTGYWLKSETGEDKLVIHSNGEFAEGITATSFKSDTVLTARYLLISYDITVDTTSEYGTITTLTGTVVDYGGTFRFTITLKPEYIQNYEFLYELLQENYTVTQVSPDPINRHTIFELTNITDDIELSIPKLKGKNKYEINWLNWDGDIVATTEHEHGTVPTFPIDLDLPMRGSDGEISYEFSGWDKAIAQATGDTSYTAVYKGIIKQPQLINDRLVYDGSLQQPEIADSNYYKMIVTSQINAGKYSTANAARITLLVQAGLSGLVWEGGSSADLLLEWEILKAETERPVLNGANKFTYNGDVREVEVSEYDASIIAVTGNAEKNAGLYSVVISLINNNYTWTGGGVEDLSFGWEITPATLNVGVKELSKIYDGKRYEFDGSPDSEDIFIEGLLGSDTPSSALLGKFAFQGGVTAEVGNHPIHLDAKDIVVVNGNYTLNLIAGTLEIMHIVDIEKPQLLQDEFEYTGKIINIKESFDDLFDESIMTLSDDESAIDTGQYTVTLTLNKNYKWADGDDNKIEFSWTIIQTTLTITADNKEKIYGENNPTFTYQYEGLKDGESLLGAINLTTDATTTSDVGEYDIVLVNIFPPLVNYIVVFNKGTLTINVKQVDEPTALPEHTSLVYTGETQYLVMQGFDEESMNVIGEYGTNADSYEARITLKSPNYAWKNIEENAVVINWQIVKAKLTVPTIDGETSFEYNTESQGLTFIPSSVGDDAWYKITDNSETNVGYYTARILLLEPQNYEWQNEEGEEVDNPLIFNWSIYAKALTIPTISGDDSFEYTGADQELMLDGFDEQLMDIDGNIKRDAGEHVISITLKDSLNYVWDDEDKTTTHKIINWFITKALLKVRVISTSVEYGDAIPVFELEYETFKGSDNPSNSINGHFSTSTTATVGSDKGEYDVILSVGIAYSINYEFELIDGILLITEKTGIIKPSLQQTEFTYTGNIMDIMPEMNNLDIAIMQIDIDASTLSAKDVDTYFITITLDNNHAWADYGDKSFTLTWHIAPATITITAEDKSRDYGENNPEFTYLISGLMGVDTVTVINGINEIEITTNAEQDSPVSGNPYAINITPNLSSDNYNFIYEAGTLTINHKILAMPDVSGGKSFQYNEQEITLQLNEYFDNDTMIVEGNIETEAGEHTATISLRDKDNYRWTDNTVNDILIYWWILEAMFARPYVESNLVYNTLPQLPVVLPTNAGDNDYYTVVEEYQTDVGTYFVTITLINDNYVWDTGTSEEIQLEWKITPQAVIAPTVNGSNSFVYSGEVQTLAFNDFDDATMVIVGASNEAKDVNNYIAEIALSDSKNYIWDNGNTENINISWRITKATLLVLVNEKTMVFGDEVPEFDITFEGFFLGDNKENSIDGEFEFVGSATEVTSASNIGSYDIIISNNLPSSQNYSFEITNSKLIITVLKGVLKPTLEIENHELYYMANSINIVEELTNFLPDIMVVTGNATAQNVGTYTITITLNSNYEWADETELSFTMEWKIVPANLTITADDKEKTYKEENPAFTYTVETHTIDTSGNDIIISSLLGDDDINNIIANFELTTNAVENSNVGVYDINITGTQISGNYIITRNSGTLKVNTLALLVPTSANTNYVYNTLLQTLEVQDFDDESMLIEGNSATNSGGYTAIITLKNSNYTWSGGGTGEILIDWTISKAEVIDPTVLNGLMFEYNESEQALVFSESEDIHLYTINDNLGKNVGSYTATVSLNDDSNYIWKTEGTSAPLTFNWEIYAKALAIPQVSGSSVFDYNGELQELALSNVIEGLISVTGNKQTDAGEHTATLSLVDSSNYVWDNVEKSITDITIPWSISKIKLTVKANDITFNFNGAPYNFNGNPQNSTDLSFEGFVAGDTKHNSISGAFEFAGEAVTAIDAREGIPYQILLQAGSATSTNYYFDFVEGELEILPLGNITKPTLSQDAFVYTGENIDITPYILNFIEIIAEKEAMSIVSGSELIAINANTENKLSYKIIISLGSDFTWEKEEGEEGEPNNNDFIIEWTIIPAPLTLEANNATRVYKQDNPPAFTYNVVGLRGSDTADIITNVVWGEEGLTAEDVGDYTIEIVNHTTTSTNYIITYLPATLTITHKPVDKVEPHFRDFTYDGTTKTLDATKFNFFNSEYMDIKDNSAINAGEYTAIIYLLPNYAWEGTTFEDIEVRWVINKATVNAPIVESGDFTYSGEMHKAVIAPSSLYTITNDEQVDAGVYWAVVTLNNPENYAWAGEPESSMPIELEWRILKYSIQHVLISADNELVYTGEDQTFDISNYDSNLVEVIGNTQKDVGDYFATISIINTNNYQWEDGTIDIITADWYITKATLYVRANDVAVEYLAEMPAFTASVSGFLGTDTQESSIIGTFNMYTNASQGSVVGGYTITIDAGSAYSNNYDFDFTNGTLTIMPLADVIMPELAVVSFDYEGNNITPEIMNLRPEIMEVYGDIFARNVLEHAEDSYTIVITLNENYAWISGYDNNTIYLEWKITRVNLTITAHSKTKVFGSVNPPLTYEVIGLVGSDSESAVGDIQLTTSAVDESSVGTYDITFVNELSSNNYNITISEATLTITHKILTKPVFSEPFTYIYDGYVKTLTTHNFDSATMNRSGHTGTNAGDYTAVISLKDNFNFKWDDESTEDIIQLWTITKVIVNKPSVLGTLIYNRNAQSPSIATSPYYTISDNIQTNAGTYYAKVVLNDKDNYIWHDGGVEDLSLQWSIERAKLTVPTMRSVVYVYHGSEQTLQLNGFDVSTMNITGNAYTNAQINYLATISIKDNSNYTWQDGTTTNRTYNWTINKAQLTIKAIDKSMIYGDAVPAFELTYDGFVSGESISVITGAFEFTGSATTVTSTSNVGQYDIIVSDAFASSINYNFNLVHAKLTITPQGGVEKPTLTKNLFNYIGENIDIKDYLNNYDSEIMSATGDIKKDAGTHTVTITIDNNHNWEGGGAKSFNLTWTISKVTLTLTADNKTKIFGEANPTLTYSVSGQVGEDQAKPISQLIIGSVNLTTTATTNSSVSGYPITFVSTPASANYNVVVVNGMLTITHKLLAKPTALVTEFTYDGSAKSISVNGFNSATMNVSGNTGTTAGDYAAIYSLKTTNYKWEDGSTANVVIGWTILKAKIAKPSITGASSFVYNGSPHTPTVASNPLYLISGNLTATNAGDYVITVTIIDKINYSWSDGTNTNLALSWTITAKLLTIPTVSGSSSFEYNASEHELKFNNLDTSTMNMSGNKNINAGNYTAVISLKDNANYKWSDGSVTSKSISWKITKAALTVTANNKTMVYGSSVPTLDYSYSAFKSGDNASNSITGTFSITTSASSSSNVGSYTISLAIGSAKSVNYELSLVNGTLTITEKTGVVKPTLKDTTFNYLASTITPEILNFNAGTMVKSGSLSERNAGNYSISITLDNNHAWVGGGAKTIILSWQIKPVALTVTAHNKTKVFGSANPALTYSVATLLGTDTINTVFSSFSVGTTATTNSNVGNYDIVINGTQISDNYIVTRVKGTLTITHKLLAKPVLTSGTVFTYDGTVKSITVSGFDSATMNVSNNSATNAGTYIATYSLKTTNYRWADGTSANVTFTWVINRITVAKPTATGSRTYNGSVQSPSITTSSRYTITGNTGTNAGNYNAKVVLKDKTNYSWTDGSTTDLTLPWSIAKFTPTMNTQTGTYAYIFGQLLNTKTITETARGVSGNIAGPFVFVTPTGKPSVGTTSVQIRFTPSDTTNYNVATFNLTISVSQIGITFVSNGGSAVAKINGEYNASINKPTDPTRSHYTFAGWYSNSGLTTAVSWPHKLISNVTFYAKWTPVKYTVSFSTSTSNGTGSVLRPNNPNAVTIASATFDYNTNYTFNLNSAPFTGLYRKTNGAAVTGLQINGSGTVYTSTITVTGNITLTFAFASTANSVTINYKGGSTSGTGTAQANSVYYGQGTNLSVVAVKKQFYVLKGYATQDVAWNNGNLGGSIPLYTQAVMNTRKVATGAVTYYAIWEPIVVKFAYNANGGSNAPATASTRFGTSSFALAARGSLARTYYTFTGWAKTAGGAKVHNASATVNINATLLNDSSYTKTAYVIGNAEVTITLYAHWTRNQTTINFIYTPGTGAPASKVLDSGSSINTTTVLAPTSWTRTGYTFDGWSLTSGGAKIATTWTVPTSTTTLYARWIARTFTVTLNKNSGTGGTNSVTATYGSNMPSATAPSRTGYTFAGYYDATSGGTQYYTAAMASSRTWNKTANTTLYARWTARTFTVTLNRNSGSGGTASVTATYGSNMPSASAPSRTGYTFAGYYDATSGGTQYYTSSMGSARTWNKAANTTLYARWTARTFTITFNANGGSGGPTSTRTATYGSAMPAASPAPTRSGYTFQGYYDTSASSGGTQYYTAAMGSARTWNKTANTTLYARWTGNTYTITLDRMPIHGWVDYPTPISVGSDTGYATHDKYGSYYAVISRVTQSVTMETYRYSAGHGNPALVLLDYGDNILASNNSHTLFHLDARITYTMRANTVYYFVVWAQSSTTRCYVEVRGSTSGRGSTTSTTTVTMGASYNLGTPYTLGAPTIPGYAFREWSDGDRMGPKVPTTGTWSLVGNRTVAAYWAYT